MYFHEYLFRDKAPYSWAEYRCKLCGWSAVWTSSVDASWRKWYELDPDEKWTAGLYQYNSCRIDGMAVRVAPAHLLTQEVLL